MVWVMSWGKVRLVISFHCKNTGLRVSNKWLLKFEKDDLLLLDEYNTLKVIGNNKYTKIFKTLFSN